MDATKLTAIAALIAALASLAVPFVSAWIKGRTDSQVADTDEGRATIEGYQALVADMRAENERLHRYVTDLQTENILFKGYVGQLMACLDRADGLIRMAGGVPPERPAFNGAGAR